MNPLHSFQRIFLGVLATLAAMDRACAQAPTGAPPTFSAQEQQAREAILTSDVWKAARGRFYDWLSVQAAYSAEQIASMKQELTARVAAMSAKELEAFLAEMQQRLEILLSPYVKSARDWADEFYTAQGKQGLLQKSHMADPMSMTPQDLAAALDLFARDRQDQISVNAAFQSSQAVQASVAKEQASAAQAAAIAAAAAPRPTSSFATPYAPRRSRESQRYEAPDRVEYEAPDGPSYEAPYREPPYRQRYEAPYEPLHYGIGPWGGLWIGH